MARTGQAIRTRVPDCKAGPGTSEAVNPPMGFRLEGQLPFGPSAVRTGRRVVDGALRGSVDEDGLHTLTVVVSELMTNAVTSGRPPLRLQLSWAAVGPQSVDVELIVEDGGCTQPKGHLVCGSRVPADSESGRGLEIVQVLAVDWQVIAGSESTRAWCRLELPAAEPDQVAR